jgi:hypothetical protein
VLEHEKSPVWIDGIAEKIFGIGLDPDTKDQGKTVNLNYYGMSAFIFHIYVIYVAKLDSKWSFSQTF